MQLKLKHFNVGAFYFAKKEMYSVIMSLDLFLAFSDEFANCIRKVVFDNFATFILKDIFKKKRLKTVPLWRNESHFDRSDLESVETCRSFRP